MRAGVTLDFQNHHDWDRFEAFERGEDVPSRPATPDATIWQEDLRLIRLVEELGFDTFWLVEHHVTPYAMTPNPLQILSFVAGATTRLDVGTMVVVLPWHNPLRVAEDITVLQHLLNGRRATIGLGRGAGRREFNALNIPMDESRGRFSEAVEILKLALGQDAFSYEGEFWQIENASVRPQPRDPQALLESLYGAWGSPSTVPIVAGLGLKPMIIPQKPWLGYRDEIAQFRAVRDERGYAPANPIVCVTVLCAETERQAEQAARVHMAEFAEGSVRNYELTGSHFATTKGYEHYADQAKAMRENVGLLGQQYFENHIWGTPGTCLAKIKAINEELSPQELIFMPRFGGMSADLAEHNMRLFAKEVLPAVRAMPVRTPVAA
jgi:alkanesulfonate monooxygenase SsuD/methylene tetrahydromethanopterin reductase-like flavin-dependent oxidoreductase (luciferase family)